VELVGVLGDQLLGGLGGQLRDAVVGRLHVSHHLVKLRLGPLVARRRRLGDEAQLGEESLERVDGVEEVLLALRVGLLVRKLPHHQGLLRDGVLERLERGVGRRHIPLLHGLACAPPTRATTQLVLQLVINNM
jgi:hypothetical protein